MRGMRVNLEQATLDCAAHYLDHLYDRTVLYPGVAAGLRRLKDATRPADRAQPTFSDCTTSTFFSA